MKLFMLTILAVAQAGVTQEKCDGVYIRNIYHERLLLKDKLNSPYQLAMDFDTNLLFFSFSLITESVTTVRLKSAYINLKTNEYGLIEGINGGFANAVDSKNRVVYLGGSDGIYTFNFDTKTAKHVAGNENIRVWQMFYKDRLYYTDFPSQLAYCYENGETKRVEELKRTRVKVVAVDKKDNIVFSNSTGLFIFKRADGKIVNVGEYEVNGFTVDNSGNIYFSTSSGIYSINEYNVVKVVELNDVYGVAIDNDNNFIYSDSDKIYKLTPSKKTCGGNKENTNNNI